MTSTEPVPQVLNDNGAWCWFQDERALVDPERGLLVVGSIASVGGKDGDRRGGFGDRRQGGGFNRDRQGGFNRGQGRPQGGFNRVANPSRPAAPAAPAAPAKEGGAQ